MRASLISSALVAALVGYGSTIALILAAAAALGATPDQARSWAFAICLTTAFGSAGLSLWAKKPVVLAWSTPGAAVIAASSGLSMNEGVAAFLLAGLLITATGLIGWLGRLITALPATLAAAMLAGVLLPFCLKVPALMISTPWLVAPIVAVFMVVRLWNPAFAVLAALAAGIALAVGGNTALPEGGLALPRLVFVAPDWSLAGLVGLGLPLYFVTMASQNLPGFAVMRGAGFEPPVRPALTVTGLLSAVSAFFAAHTVNMAAITAAICLGKDVHPDPAQRWRVGLAYGGFWLCLGLFGPAILAGLSALPPQLIATIAGLALIAPLIGALVAAFTPEEGRFPAAVTLLVAASGISILGVSGAFWGLMAGLAALGLERLATIWRRSFTKG